VRPAATVDEVRRVVAQAFGDARLSGIADDEALLGSGAITSVELVDLGLVLEQRFGVRLADSALASSASLKSLALALSGRPDHAAGDVTPLAAPRPLVRCARRPLLFGLALVVSALVLDRLVGHLFETAWRSRYVEFLEGGQRLYPYSGTFAQRDFRFALANHAIRRDPAGARRWAVFGDSGTIGSFLTAAESLPAQIEREVNARDRPAVDVANLAYFGRLVAKDLMLLELVWDVALERVIFTVGTDYFQRSSVERWIREYPHCSVNLPHFQSFLRRVPEAERGPFLEIEQLLRQADRTHLGPLHRLAFSSLATPHYAPFVQYWLTVDLLPPSFGSRQRWEIERVRRERFALSAPHVALDCEIQENDLDRRQAQMLTTAIRLLAARGTRSVLYIEPRGPREWRRPSCRATDCANVALEIGAATGATVVDLSWELSERDFLDSSAHYTAEANRRLATALAAAILREPRPHE
jgi:acyl carrier protein